MKQVVMYNEQIKERFIESYKHTNKKAYTDARRVFAGCYDMETLYDCDLSEMSKELIFKTLYENNWIADQALWIFNKVYKAYQEFLGLRAVTIYNTEYRKWAIENCPINYVTSVQELYNICLEIKKSYCNKPDASSVADQLCDKSTVYYLILYLGLSLEEQKNITIKDVLSGFFFEKYPIYTKTMQQLIRNYAIADSYIVSRTLPNGAEALVNCYYENTPYLLRQTSYNPTEPRNHKISQSSMDKLVNPILEEYQKLYTDQRLSKIELVFAKVFNEIYQDDMASKDYSVLIGDTVAADVMNKYKPYFGDKSKTSIRDMFQKYAVYKGQRMLIEGKQIVYQIGNGK